MASEYNSNLISKLYQSTNQKEIIEILKDMGEIKDAVFLKPILDTYKKHKNSSIGHYFISVLDKINSEDMEESLLDLLKEVLKDKRIRHFIWVLTAMDSHDFYPDEANEVAKQYIENCINEQFRTDYRVNGIDFSYVLEYLEGAKLINKHQHTLRTLLFDSNLDRDEGKIVLSYLIRINVTEEINHFIEVYTDKIKGREIEIIIAKELTGWKGGNVKKIKDLILENGHNRAKEIIKEEYKKNEEDRIKLEKTIQQKEAATFGNIKIVDEIRELRDKINTKTQSHSSFRFELFLDSELLIKQAKSPSDKSSFISLCIDLRSIIKNISKEVKNHGFDEANIKKLLPHTEENDIGKILNQFYLYLEAKKIKTDSDLFGLKSMNKILNLLAHPEGKKKLLKELEEIGILNIYKKSEWSKIHNYLLEWYKKILNKTNKALD